MNKQLDVDFLQEKLDHQLNNCSSFSIITLKRALTVDSKFSAVYYNIGRQSYEQQHYSKAEKHFKRAVMIDPNFSDAYFCLGVTYSKQNNPKKALKAFQQVIHLDPTFFPAFSAYGQSLFELGDFYKAAETFEKALAKKPTDLNANNCLGFILLIQQRYEEAIKCFKIAINHNQDEKSVYEWINWSIALFQQGKKEEAVEILQKGMTLRDKSRNENHQKQEIIEVYARTLVMLENKALELKIQKEKVGVDKAITGIKFIIDLLENFKEEKL